MKQHWKSLRGSSPYLEAALDAIDAEFGGIRGYLEAVGLGEVEITELRERYLAA